MLPAMPSRHPLAVAIVALAASCGNDRAVTRSSSRDAATFAPRADAPTAPGDLFGEASLIL
jgi:hypothetical protein